MVVITQILGTDSVSASRVIFNANFNALKAEVDNIESVFGMSLVTGNLDMSANTGGEIKANKFAGKRIELFDSTFTTPQVQINITPGAISAISLTASGSVVSPIGEFNSSLTAQDTSINGFLDINGYSRIKGGMKVRYSDISAISTGEGIHQHIVMPADAILHIGFTMASRVLDLSVDASIEDGHIVTLINKGTTDFILSSGNILGMQEITLYKNYSSSITLQYMTAQGSWVVLSNSNASIVAIP
jgi:hypothetical protein